VRKPAETDWKQINSVLDLESGSLLYPNFIYCRGNIILYYIPSQNNNQTQKIMQIFPDSPDQQPPSLPAGHQIGSDPMILGELLGIEEGIHWRAFYSNGICLAVKTQEYDAGNSDPEFMVETSMYFEHIETNGDDHYYYIRCNHYYAFIDNVGDPEHNLLFVQDIGPPSEESTAVFKVTPFEEEEGPHAGESFYHIAPKFEGAEPDHLLSVTHEDAGNGQHHYVRGKGKGDGKTQKWKFVTAGMGGY
jgi:hypothetical protein